MRRSVARIRGLAFLLWHLKHEMTHVLLGLLWAWFLREIWAEFNVRWITISVIGSLLPDIEHFIFFFSYGKKDPYTQGVFTLLKGRQWRNLAVFMSIGHKHNTNLRYHNYYFMSVLFALSILCLFLDWNSGVVLFGAMLTHYCFDVVDDIITLGRVNPNWKRWGRPKSHHHIS